MSSILKDIKHMLGLLPSDTAFDVDVIIHINGALSTLTQLGVGPVQGFRIESEAEEWTQFVNDPRLDSVKTYVYLKTKLGFDPPATGFTTQSIERQLDELVFRINSVVDYG